MHLAECIVKNVQQKLYCESPITGATCLHPPRTQGSTRDLTAVITKHLQAIILNQHTHVSNPHTGTGGYLDKCLLLCMIIMWTAVTHLYNYAMMCCYSCRNDKVLAVSSLNSDPVVSQSAELMFQGRMPTGTQLK